MERPSSIPVKEELSGTMIGHGFSQNSVPRSTLPFLRKFVPYENGAKKIIIKNEAKSVHFINLDITQVCVMIGNPPQDWGKIVFSYN